MKPKRWPMKCSCAPFIAGSTTVKHCLSAVKLWRIDCQGELHVTVDVDVAFGTPPPARIGLTCQLAEVYPEVSWLGLGPHENYPDRKQSALFDRWQRPLDRNVHPVCFPDGKRPALRHANTWNMVTTSGPGISSSISAVTASTNCAKPRTATCLSQKQAAGLNWMVSIWASVGMTPGAQAFPQNTCLISSIIITS